MSLLTRLASFLPISLPVYNPEPPVLHGHLHLHGEHTHSFYSRSPQSTPRGPSGPAPSTTSRATRRLSQPSPFAPHTVHVSTGTPNTITLHTSNTHCTSHTVQKVLFVFMPSSYAKTTVSLLILQKRQSEKLSIKFITLVAQ